MTARAASTTLAVKVVPKAAGNEIVGWLGDALKIRVTAAPEAGRANAAVEALLAAALGVAPSAVRVVVGRAAARKRIAIDGLDRAEIERRLARAGAGKPPPPAAQ